MSTQVQYRRGTAAQNNSFVGALAEITVDTTNGTLRVHDGITAGGSNIATVAFVNNAIGSLSADSISNGTSNVKVLSSGGNIQITVANSPRILFTTAGIQNAQANGVGNIGNATGYFNTVFAKATSAQYADLAERYLADQNYPVGTVLVFDGVAEVTASARSHDTAVAGTVSENPSYIMNAGLAGDNVVTVALLGRVPCRVIGRIQKGDLLVTSDQPGVATCLDPTRYQPGAVLGKSLESYDSDQEGVVEIAVGRV